MPGSHLAIGHYKCGNAHGRLVEIFSDGKRKLSMNDECKFHGEVTTIELNGTAYTEIYDNGKLVAQK